MGGTKDTDNNTSSLNSKPCLTSDFLGIGGLRCKCLMGLFDCHMLYRVVAKAGPPCPLQEFASAEGIRG